MCKNLYAYNVFIAYCWKGSCSGLLIITSANGCYVITVIKTSLSVSAVSNSGFIPSEPAIICMWMIVSSICRVMNPFRLHTHLQTCSVGHLNDITTKSPNFIQKRLQSLAHVSLVLRQ